MLIPNNGAILDCVLEAVQRTLRRDQARLLYILACLFQINETKSMTERRSNRLDHLADVEARR